MPQKRTEREQRVHDSAFNMALYSIAHAATSSDPELTWGALLHSDDEAMATIVERACRQAATEMLFAALRHSPSAWPVTGSLPDDVGLGGMVFATLLTAAARAAATYNPLQTDSVRAEVYETLVKVVEYPAEGPRPSTSMLVGAAAYVTERALPRDVSDLHRWLAAMRIVTTAVRRNWP
jgi:hypothetical protein